MRLPWILVALALAACQPTKPTLAGMAGGTGSPAYVAPPSDAPRPLAIGGKLVGKAKIPEGLVAGSAGLLKLDGAGIVSDRGAAYGLLAEGQKPLSGFTVKLLDVAGQPVLDGAGKPYEAQTDAKGDYAFTTTPVGKNVVVALDLPNGLGRVMGFLPAPAGNGVRNVDLEGVGTHVLGYLLDQHVKGDAARFARLDPAEEKAARADAEAALLANAKGRLDAATLATAQLVATVGVWRGQSKPFDARLTAIVRTLDGLPPATPTPAPTPTATPSAAPSAAPSS